ncbi:MAG: glycerate kinase type-2 family protein [Nitrososphaerota archaeon]
MIKNKHQIYNEKTKDALDILETGLCAATPESFLVRFVKRNQLLVPKINLSKFGKIYIVSVGKAADAMAKFVHSTINSDGGIVVIPQTHTPVFSNKKFRIIRASHPIPNNSSIVAAKSIIYLLKSTKKEDLVIFLVSGGTSPLVCLPDGITLKQKQQLTQLLLKSGASIQEINALRKHLSLVKGGKLLENLNCQAVSYVMSDVLGDDLSSIASGLTYYDKTTFQDCLKIIRKYNLSSHIPKQIMGHLGLGALGKIPETPKTPKIQNIVIASNKDCISAMAKKAKKLGYATKTLHSLSGDVSLAAKKVLRNFPGKSNSCLIFGGETTVKVKGAGRGGRNQELVLQILKRAAECVIVSIGTDGVDGNTKHAGAISYFAVKKTEIDRYLKNNDSNSFFKKHGGLVMTGPTHTNLLDIGLILKS